MGVPAITALSASDESAEISRQLPGKREVAVGITLFVLNLLLYCLNTVLVRIVLEKFRLSAFEVTYLFSFPLIPIAYIGFRSSAPKTADFLRIPRDLFWPFLGRCVCGFLSDVTLFLAFTYTAYGTAIAVGKLETVF